MKITKRTVVLAISVSLCLCGSARSIYNTSYNNFGSLDVAGTRIEDGLLRQQNVTEGAVVTLDTVGVDAPTYRYALRLANLANKPGRALKVTRASGARFTPESPTWGLVFNAVDNENYDAVVLRCANTSRWDDLRDERYMTATLVRARAGLVTTLDSCRVTKGMNLYEGLGNLRVAIGEDRVKVSLGKDELTEVLETPLKRPEGEVRVGFLVGSGSDVAVERAVLTVEQDEHINQMTPWTRETLDAYFERSSDPLEGYWQYLDRDVDEECLRLGGRYTIAVVRATDGYDIIYIAGAQVKKSLWREGMLKGHLRRTMFSDHYDAMWVDATLLPFVEDVYGEVENGVILKLEFPVYKSQVRFAKRLQLE